MNIKMIECLSNGDSRFEVGAVVAISVKEAIDSKHAFIGRIAEFTKNYVDTNDTYITLDISETFNSKIVRIPVSNISSVLYSADPVK